MEFQNKGLAPTEEAKAKQQQIQDEKDAELRDVIHQARTMKDAKEAEITDAMQPARRMNNEKELDIQKLQQSAEHLQQVVDSERNASQSNLQ